MTDLYKNYMVRSQTINQSLLGTQARAVFLLIIWEKQILFAIWVHLYFLSLDIDLFLITIETIYIFVHTEFVLHCNRTLYHLKTNTFKPVIFLLIDF